MGLVGRGRGIERNYESNFEEMKCMDMVIACIYPFSQVCYGLRGILSFCSSVSFA